MSLLSGPTQSSVTVVIVNGDAAERDTLFQLVSAAGQRAMVFATAADALAALAPPWQTVVLVNNALPDMSGSEFVHELRRRGVTLPTIVTVPTNAIGEAVQAIRHGATDILELPLQGRHLLQSIEQALRNKSTRGE